MKFVLVIMLALSVSCKKNNTAIPEKKSATRLLTQKIWILTGAGFDDNKNGILDTVENSIQDCQRDNTFIFNNTGTGSALDNALTCGTPVNNNFN